MMTQFFQVLKLFCPKYQYPKCFMMTQFFQVLKLSVVSSSSISRFYDDSILPGTKTCLKICTGRKKFYDDSILPGTKTSNHIFSKAKIFLTYYHHLVYYSIYTVCIKAFSKLFFILYLSKCIPIDSFNNLRKTYSLSIGVYNSQPI